MRKHLRWLIPVIVVLAIGGGVVAYQLYQRLSASVEVVGAAGSSIVATPMTERANDVVMAQVANRLLMAGLTREGVLDSTGVETHLQRLQEREIDAATLLQYADDLETLNRFTVENGAQIPADFWDVRTDLMIERDLDEYTLVRGAAMPESAPYIRLLARAYERFLAFKEGEATGEDTALDAALDILLMTDEYNRAVYDEIADDADAQLHDAQAKLMVWQSLIAGTSRTNPLTGKPMFSHGLFTHNSLPIIWQYDQGEYMNVAEAWGVTGFAPQFVGTPKNNNQIEHMSISAFLQFVMDEPVLALNSIEEEKLFRGRADSAEAHADMALNNAIAYEFVPFYVTQKEQAVDHFRCFLKDECGSWQLNE
jgi:hypothetical protein